MQLTNDPTRNDFTPQRRPMQKAHADLLAGKASRYFIAKAMPRNFCKSVEDTDEGVDLLQAFDECVADGMDPHEGSSLIVKCAGAMGGPMAGPLAATLATRPVKKMADATVMDSNREVAKSFDLEGPVTDEMREMAREILKSTGGTTRVAHHKSHYRVRNGRVEYVHDFDAIHHGSLPIANLHQRSVRGFNRNGQDYIRATDAEDRDRILRYARENGIDVESHRQSGANHHGRQSAYPHIYFHRASDAARVHAMLANEEPAIRQPEVDPSETEEIMNTPDATIASERAAAPPVTIIRSPAMGEPAPATEAWTRTGPGHRAGELIRQIRVEGDSTRSRSHLYEIRRVSENGYVLNHMTGRTSQTRRVETLTPQPVSDSVVRRKLEDVIRQQVYRNNYHVVADRAPDEQPEMYYVARNFEHPASPTLQASPSPVAQTPTPAPAPTAAAPPGYERLRDQAYNTGDRARSATIGTPESIPILQAAVDSHKAALEKAEALGIMSGNSRGAAWHQERLSHWKTKLRESYVQGATAAGQVFQSALAQTMSSGTGYGTLLARASNLIKWGEMEPPGGHRPDAVKEGAINALRSQIPAFAGGAMLENAKGRAESEDAAGAIDQLITATSRIAAENMHTNPEGFTENQTRMHSAITGVHEAIVHSQGLLAGVESGDIEPETALEAIRKVGERATKASEAAAATNQIWAKPVQYILGVAAGKVQAIRPRIQQIMSRPRVADLRHAKKADHWRAQADASHATAMGPKATHTHVRIAFDHAKRAAVATFHDSLQKKGRERQALQAKAQEYADRAKALAERYAAVGRR